MLCCLFPVIEPIVGIDRTLPLLHLPLNLNLVVTTGFKPPSSAETGVNGGLLSASRLVTDDCPSTSPFITACYTSYYLQVQVYYLIRTD